MINNVQYSLNGNSHHNLKLPWTGTTNFSGHQCNNVDARIDRLYNLQSANLDVSMSQQRSVDVSTNLDVDMSHTKSVRFDHSLDSYQFVTPHSEIYGQSHPHTLLATAAGWKANPAHADIFAGKSSAVMQARRKEATVKLKSSRAHSTRLRRIKVAKQ